MKSRHAALVGFLAPSLALIALFYFAPMVLTFAISLTEMGRSLRWDFTGFGNFEQILRLEDPLLPRIITNTAVYAAFALLTTIVGGLLVATLSMRMKPRAGVFFRLVFFLPRAIPPVVWGFLWAWAFEGTRFGLFNGIRNAVGLPIVHWLNEYPMVIVVLANGFLGVSLSMLVFSSAIAVIPRDLTRAAEIDGASSWQITRYVTLPLLKWPILTMTAWHLMSFVNSYVYILLITNGGPYHATEVLSLYAYKTAFQQYEYGYGASLTVLLVVINLLLLWIVLRAFGAGKMLQRGRVEA